MSLSCAFFYSFLFQIHSENDMMTLDRLDLSKRHQTPINQQALTFFSVMALLGAIFLFTEKNQIYVHWPRVSNLR